MRREYKLSSGDTWSGKWAKDNHVCVRPQQKDWEGYTLPSTHALHWVALLLLYKGLAGQHKKKLWGGFYFISGAESCGGLYVPTCWAALCAETAVPAKHEPLSHGGPKASLLPGLVGSHGSPGGPKTFFPTLFISLSNRRVLLDLAEAMQYFWSSCVPMYLSISSISIFLDMGRSVQYSSSQIYSPFKISVAVHHNI